MKHLWPWLLLTACVSPGPPLQFNMGVESVQLDWNRSIDSTSVVVVDNIMEGLTTYADSLQGNRAELMRPMPALAASWAISEGGRLYRFHLKAGVQWSDGVELEAQHFVDSWRRLLEPGVQSPNAYHLFDVENAQAFNEGREKDFGRVGVRAVDKHTLEVRLRRQAPYFLHLVASTITFPVRKDLIQKYGDQWLDPENLVTLGPYRITEWVQGDRLVLESYGAYHGSAPAISKVICRLIAEPLTALAFYENEKLDILPRDLPPSFVGRLRQSPDYRTGPKLQVSYLLFNTRRAPFDSAEKRRAFIRSLNRQLLASFFPGTQAPFNGWVPPGLLGYDESVGLAAEGKESDLLAGKSVEIRYSGSDTWNLVFQSVQRQLEEKLKLKAKITQLDGPDYSDFIALLSSPRRIKSEPLPHILHLGWVADYPDSRNFMNVFTSTSESNYSGWRNKQYDQLVEHAFPLTDENARAQLYIQAQRLLLEEEAVIMPLFFTSHQALVRSSLRGVQLNVLDKWYFRNLSFENEGWKSFGRSFLRRLHGGRGEGGGA